MTAAEMNLTNTEPPQESKSVYVSALTARLKDVFPALRAEGITIDFGHFAVEGSDLFLGIYGFDSIGDIQKREYQLAREKGKPVLAFVHSGYVYNTPPIGVFDLLSLPQDNHTKIVSFGPHEQLTEPVLREIRRFFANGKRFDVTDDPEAGLPEVTASSKENRTPDAPDLVDALVEEGVDARVLEGIGRAEKLRLAGRFDEALEEYTRLIEYFPENVMARIERAEVLRQTRRYEEAMAAYNEISELFPDSVLARMGRAEVLRETRHFDEALAEYSRVIESSPDNLAAHLGRAEVFRDIKRLDDALQDYGWVIKSHPKNEEARAGYAQVLAERERSGEASSTGDDVLVTQTSEDPAPVVEASQLAAETIPATQPGSDPPSSKTVTPRDISNSRKVLSILEAAAQVQVQLGRSILDSPMLLICMLDSEDDRLARAFLSSFGMTREKLFGALKLHYLRVVVKDYEGYLSPGVAGLLTQSAWQALRKANNLALAENKDEVQPRQLFQALMSNTEPGDWIETTIGKDVVGWISHTLHDWDDATPITQATVQAKMMEDDLFQNPPTQRDSAAEKDLLGFEEYAEALVQIIRRPETRAPLVIGVYGPWGSGKSTFMGLVKRKLDALGQPTETEPSGLKAFLKRQVRRLRGLFRKGERSLRVTTVDYDAWAYADAQKLWSGLVDKIAKELDAELTTRDRIAYLINSHSRRLLAAFALGLIPVALFALGYAAQHTPAWINNLSPVWSKYWLKLPGWVATSAWALYAYFLQRRPVTDAVATLAAKFDSAPTAGLVSRIQDEFKTALQTRINPDRKPKTVEALRTDIRQRVERNELKVVVFIDELDRCPLEKIVEILEAIKLFLAEDIFIVLLGVDTRVAAEAIRLHYKEVQNPNLPREYLEKIVQLPLRVPSAGQEHIKNYLHSFMTLPEEGGQDGSATETTETRPAEVVQARESSGSNGAAVTPVPPAVEEGVIEAQSSAAAAGLREGTAEPEQSAKPVAEEVAAEARVRTPYDSSSLSRSTALPQMPDTKTEFDAMAAIARDFLDSNPRRIKRLLNTYRYVKILAARLPGSQVQTALWQQTMLYWLAFTMKWPSFMGKAILAAEQPEAKNVTGSFLVSELQTGGGKQSQPEVEKIETYLALTAVEIVEHHKLAPNFLIENPDLDRKEQNGRPKVADKNAGG